MAGTDPAVAQSDFDHDGLGIATERGDVIGAWACFHIPDIFVEVDWMEGHEMSDDAVAKVVWAFAKHGIALHIDRGEMGGGSQVAHYSPIAMEDVAGNNNDFWDYKWGNGWDTYPSGAPNDEVDVGLDNLHGCFDVARFRIFHYCLFVHMMNCDGGHIQDIIFGGHAGIADYPGDDILLSDGHPLIIDSTAEAGTFMHELGHNLHLDRDNYGIQLDGPVTCMNYAYIFSVVDYTPTEWSAIDLTAIEGVVI